MTFSVVQSVPICLALAASGGAIEVLATAVLAYQDAREKEGHYQSKFMRYIGLTLNIVLQLSSSVIGHLFAPWFGPVSLVGPVFLSSQLLVNLLVFGLLLGLENFTKDMQIGTYIVVIAVIMLPIVGPAAQDDQDIETLLETWYAIVWSALLLVGMTVSSILIIALKVEKLQEHRAILLLLSARATTFAVNLTASKVMIMKTDTFIFVTAIFLKVASGAMQTFAIVVQSTAVTQAKFIPLNASALIIVNALTGMIIWVRFDCEIVCIITRLSWHAHHYDTIHMCIGGLESRWQLGRIYLHLCSAGTWKLPLIGGCRNVDCRKHTLWSCQEHHDGKRTRSLARLESFLV